MTAARLRPLLLAMSLALATPVYAELPLPKGVVAGPSVEGISEYRLANGLRVLLFPDATKPTVTVNITYGVGSRHENYGETGMAHLLEHLLFKGTPRHPDITGAFKKRGIGYNASTWLDRTNYFGNFAAGADNLEFLLRLEADRMVNANIARKDLDSEMTVVRNEMESGETNPFRVLMSRLTATAYLWHNYGNSTIGARADVENLPIERLQAFYKMHYRPDNATLLVAGRIDPAKTLALVAQAFAAVAKPTTPLQPTYTAEPTQDGEREVVVRRIGDSRLLGLAYHIPAAAHADAAPLQVLGQVLGDTPSGRLHKALVETRRAAAVSASPLLLAEPGAFLVFAQLPRDGDDQAVVDQLLPLVEDATATPVSKDEVERAKARLLKNNELLFNDPNATAMALSESIASGDWRLFFVQRDRIAQVSADDVNRVARLYFKPENRTLGRFLPSAKPQRAEIPATPAIASLVDGYQGRAAIAQGEAFDPTPANIDGRTVLGKLANGTEVSLLSKENRGDVVNLSLSFQFGREAELLGKDTAASTAASMLLRGSESLSREQISEKLDALKARLAIDGDAQGVSVNASSTREHLPALLDLIADLLKHPRFDDAEFEQLRTQMITALQAQMSEPQAIAFNALNRHFGAHWPKGHPNYPETFEESMASIKATTLADTKAFHQAFYGAGRGQIAVVGDFDADAIKVKLEAHFGQWTSAKPFERIANPLVAHPAVARQFETPDKANAVILMSGELPVSDRHPDYPALLAANYIFGGGSMKSRLADRIRQQDGLSYSTGASLTVASLDDNATHLLYAIAAPENIGKVEAAFKEELARWIRDGVAADELKDAIDGILNSRALGRSEDTNLAGQLRSNLYLQRRMAFSSDIEARLKALDKPTVDAAIRSHFGKLAYSRFSAGDFAKLSAATKP